MGPRIHHDVPGDDPLMRFLPRGSSSVALLTALFAAGPLRAADERLAGIACRSVHLSYPAPAGTAYVNEVTVDASAPGTYFCVCGFDRGYFGIQELASGRKLVIFSVWDPGRQNDPNSVADDRRTRLLAKDPAVRVGRFGGEGTGGQSFLDLDWKAGQTYRFLVTARPDGDGQRTAYSAYLATPEAPAWRHLATFSSQSGKTTLGGYYAFVEDFRRNRVSATLRRSARFGPGWVRETGSDHWVPLQQARFTADRNPSTAIDASTEKDRFLLATGGTTTNDHVKLWQTFRLETPISADRPTGPPLP